MSEPHDDTVMSSSAAAAAAASVIEASTAGLEFQHHLLPLASNCTSSSEMTSSTWA